MTDRNEAINDTSARYPRINVTDTPKPCVDPQEVAKALGAEVVGPAPKGFPPVPPPRNAH